MRNHFDRIAKHIAQVALAPFGATVAHAEISPETQYADVQHDPDPARAAERERLGLLGQIASNLCLIEVYSDAPSGEEFRACLSKHVAFWQQRARRARALNKEREQDPELPDLVGAPFLWVITARVPATLVTELALEAASGWPAGVCLYGGSVLRVGLVMASKLPRERSTLLVRLMAGGPLLADAASELFRLPSDAHERAIAERHLVKYFHALQRKPNRDSLEEEFMDAMYTTMEDYRTEAHAKGHVKGLAEALLITLDGRGIAVPAAAHERILAERNPEQLTRWLERAGIVTSIDDLLRDADLLRTAR